MDRRATPDGADRARVCDARHVTRLQDPSVQKSGALRRVGQQDEAGTPTPTDEDRAAEGWLCASPST